MQEQKQEYMRRALALAQRGAGHVNPNPMVGCVIVKDGKIIGEGWHEHIGGLHAERNAFAHCTEDCTGADLYVTLDPSLPTPPGRAYYHSLCVRPEKYTDGFSPAGNA